MGDRSGIQRVQEWEYNIAMDYIYVYIYMSFNYQIVTAVVVRSARLLSMSLVLEYTKEIDMMSSRKMTFVLFLLVCT